MLDLGLEPATSDLSRVERFERQWEFAASDARESAKAIECALDLAREEINEESRDFPNGYTEEIELGIHEWKQLKKTTGFSLEDTFRRRELIPFTFVPKHVADRHGDGERMSLFIHLQQAHDAFIFGVPFAALAMMRSVLELVLREHYGASGPDLDGLIDNAATRLPKGANWRDLHELRGLANAILHFRNVDLPDQPKLERMLIQHLFCLRDLIESAPPRIR